MTSDRARQLAQELVSRSDVLLHETVESDEGGSPRGRLADGLGPRGWLTHPAVAVFLIVIVVASVTEAIIAALSKRSPEPPGFGLVLFRIAVVWLFASTPGWIYVRYLIERVPSLWDEYVLNLYRLGLDRPENLPRPPLSSPFFKSWQAAGGEDRLQDHNVYRQKFDAYSGVSASVTGMDRLHRARVETLFPVFLLTAVLSVYWTALLWDVHSLDLGSGAVKLWTCPAFGFLGAYAFGVNLLVRRFLRNDLRPSAYAGFALRVIIVFLLAIGIHPLLNKLGADSATQAVVMFVVGIFPVIILRVVQRMISTTLRLVVPPLSSDYPLSNLDGMSVWYESQLQGEGIEDMQGLVTTNIVDVVLHTRIQTGRLIDWIDQSILLLHLGGSEQDLAPKLRQLGIRTATDLLAVFPLEEMESGSKLTGSTKASLDAVAKLGIDATTVRKLVRTISREPGLGPILNWRSGRPSVLSTEATATAGTPSHPEAERHGLTDLR